jgi:2-polyprenyl-6-methoxyphenol hydroxylase-like FAD-dependent oxidoreductase
MTEGAADVLVIGAGPSGLFAALELARHGVIVRVVERDPVPHHQARATALQPGTLEILASAGVIDSVLASSEHLGFAQVLDAALGVVGEVAFAGAGSPWDHQCSLPQWRTEQILTERLTELGGSVDRGVEVVALDDRDDRVLVTLRRAGGDTERAEARWVIGAGGAHSLTRASMAEELTGGTYPGTALVADVRVRCPIRRDAATLIATPNGYVLLGPLPDERWITFVGDLQPDEIERAETDPGFDAVRDAYDRRLADAVLLEDVAWAAAFRMHHRLVSHLADGRCFLLGDAGHLSSPFGGEGLNSGIWDAHNLAWKLALEVGGHARPALLESYDAERVAADRHVVEVSDALHAVAHQAVESARTGESAGPPPTPEQVAALVRTRSMLDVTYAGSPLVGEHIGADGAAASAPAPGPGERYPDRTTLTGTRHHLLLFGAADETALARVRSRWEGLVDVQRSAADPLRAGLCGDGAVLIRPDGHIGFRATPADAVGLDALDAHLGSYLVLG